MVCGQGPAFDAEGQIAGLDPASELGIASESAMPGETGSLIFGNRAPAQQTGNDPNPYQGKTRLHNRRHRRRTGRPAMTETDLRHRKRRIPGIDAKQLTQLMQQATARRVLDGQTIFTPSTEQEREQTMIEHIDKVPQAPIAIHGLIDQVLGEIGGKRRRWAIEAETGHIDKCSAMLATTSRAQRCHITGGKSQRHHPA